MRMAECHPDRIHCAKGLCRPCYNTANAGSAKASRKRWLEANREAARASARKYKLTYSEAVRAAKLRWRYSISIAEYEELLTSQNGLCKICNKYDSCGNKLSVDHCHKTGRVRGLLCGNCNRGLGLLGDSLERLLLAAVYLSEPELCRQ